MRIPEKLIISFDPYGRELSRFIQHMLARNGYTEYSIYKNWFDELVRQMFSAVTEELEWYVQEISTKMDVTRLIKHQHILNKEEEMIALTEQYRKTALGLYFLLQSNGALSFGRDILPDQLSPDIIIIHICE